MTTTVMTATVVVPGKLRPKTFPWTTTVRLSQHQTTIHFVYPTPHASLSRQLDWLFYDLFRPIQSSLAVSGNTTLIAFEQGPNMAHQRVDDGGAIPMRFLLGQSAISMVLAMS